MRIIKIDASHWVNILDFYASFLAALGAPEWHGTSIDALIDSMVWGEINSIEPPYNIVIYNTIKIPQDISDEIKTLKKALIEARAYFRSANGHDVDVSLDMAD